MKSWINGHTDKINKIQNNGTSQNIIAVYVFLVTLKKSILTT